MRLIELGINKILNDIALGRDICEHCGSYTNNIPCCRYGEMRGASEREKELYRRYIKERGGPDRPFFNNPTEPRK